MRWISYTCFTVGIISVISATTLSIQAIWGEATETFGKGLATCGVILLACFIVGLLNMFITFDNNSDESNQS